MKNKFIGLLILVSACSGSDQPEDNALPPLNEYGVIEGLTNIGSVEQALTQPGNYGVLSNNFRCNGTALNCILPQKKVYNFRDQTGNCTGGTKSWYTQAFSDAYGYWKPILQNRGWTVTLNQPNDTASPRNRRVDHTVTCGGDSLGVYIAGTVPNCVSGGFGTFTQCFEYNATTYLHQPELDHLLLSSTDAIHQRNMMQTITGHELGHGLGFGHAKSSECVIPVSNEIMCSGGAINVNDESTWGTRNASSEEKNWLRDYVSP